jgi:small subunit ribosomal protein S1
VTEEPEEDFAALFAASETTNKPISQGQAVEGRIVAIGKEAVLVDIGAKGEAELAIAELTRDDGTLDAQVGDRIQATVVSTGGTIKLSRKLQRGAAAARQLQDAFATGLPVEGKVEKAVKSGYEVRVAGQRAFCPQSQIDIVRDTDSAVHIGKTYTFRIADYRDDGQKFVVSRRALLEAERAAQAAKVRETLSVGAVVTGRVASVRDFGAFVDLGGGVQGLLHVSEMGWSRVANPAAVVTPGDEITVKVLRIEPQADADDKIALGVKQLSGDPWERVGDTYAVGQVREARVTRISDFGAFVELEPGVEALAHASTFAPTGKRDGWKQSVAVGETATFEILSIEPDKKRIGVTPVDPASARAGAATRSRSAVAPGARLTGTVERHEKFGFFVFLAPGLSGLVPLAESGVAREGDVAGAFPVGAPVEVIVLEADAAGRRIRLSVKAVKAADEAAEVREYAAREGAAAETSGFGGLADKLRGALANRK